MTAQLVTWRCYLSIDYLQPWVAGPIWWNLHPIPHAQSYQFWQRTASICDLDSFGSPFSSSFWILSLSHFSSSLQGWRRRVRVVRWVVQRRCSPQYPQLEPYQIWSAGRPRAQLNQHLLESVSQAWLGRLLWSCASGLWRRLRRRFYLDVVAGWLLPLDHVRICAHSRSRLAPPHLVVIQAGELFSTSS